MRLILLLLTAFLLVFFSCGNDDMDETSSSFYSNVDTSATDLELEGNWAIFSVKFNGNITDVPINYQDCGRDFFVFGENNIYTEYLFQNSDCQYDVNALNWTLNNGVITLSNQFNQSDELVITSLTQNQFVFKARIDIDEDGVLDILTFYAQRYQPIGEIDMVSDTFTVNTSDEFENLISFTWQAYNGFNEFDRYEIYRSVGDNCSKDNAILISTITDVNITEYTDLQPPGEDKLCYYIKVYTNQGLLGESILNSLLTQFIYPSAVGLSQPTVNNNEIEFTWQISDDPYFSHYELVFSNYAGQSASGQQEYTVTIINDVNTNVYLDINPPYLENPFYILYVHNIFGNKTTLVNNGVTSYWEVEFKREEIIDLQSVESYAIDPNEPIVYFYGRESGEGNIVNIHRFNYSTNQTEAVSNLSPQVMTSIPIKVFNSGYGKEVIMEQGSDLYVYNANTMEYKYTLDTGILGVDDFTYSSNGYWVFTTNDDVYTSTRDNTNLTIVDTKPHFPNFQSSYNYQVFALNNDKVLIGHNNEPDSYVFDINGNGMFFLDQIVPIPIMDNWESKTQYNSLGNYIINFQENRLYSTQSFSLLESFEQPHFPTGTSINGLKILGSNNNPNWQISPESIHSKQVVIFDRVLQTSTAINSIGYPHIVFENYNGDIMSISSGLKKEDIQQNINNKADLFIELIELP